MEVPLMQMNQTTVHIYTDKSTTYTRVQIKALFGAASDSAPDSPVKWWVILTSAWGNEMVKEEVSTGVSLFMGE
jgi:hypothetical protein